MPKVYTTVPGAETVISHFGPATNDRPCVVPEAVAAEMAALPEFRVEPDEVAPAAAMKKGKAAPAAVEAADASKIEKE